MMFAAGDASASVVFQDTTNNPSDYLQVIDYALNGSTASFGGTTSLQFSEGQPVGSTTNVLIGAVNKSFVYDPSVDGAITSIDASVIKQLTVINNRMAVPGDNGSITVGSTFRVLVDQGGSFYEAAIPGTPVTAAAQSTTVGPAEHLFQNGLTADNFFSIDLTTGTFGADHPNFTSTGGSIDFGIVQYLGAAPTAGPFSDVGSYTQLTLGISAVPLPASAPLFGAGLVALAALGYGVKRKDKATSAA